MAEGGPRVCSPDSLSHGQQEQGDPQRVPHIAISLLALALGSPMPCVPSVGMLSFPRECDLEVCRSHLPSRHTLLCSQYLWVTQSPQALWGKTTREYGCQEAGVTRATVEAACHSTSFSLLLGKEREQ